MRLDRFLAETGFGSRSDVKKLIKKGGVTVNGESVCRPEVHIDENCDEVFVGTVAAVYRKFIYLMLNKPGGYVSATWDKKLPTVIDLLPEEYRHFEPFPVGRLDIDTEGLLILTNNGALAHRLLSPKSHVPKTYVARLEKPALPADAEAFREGVVIEGGYKTLPASLVPFSGGDGENWAEVVIAEGKFHQVKQMFEATGNKVEYLKRIKMNNLCLDSELPTGKMRELTKAEEKSLIGDLEQEG